MAGQFRTLVQSIAQKSVSSGTWASLSSSIFDTSDAAMISRMNNLPVSGSVIFAALFPAGPLDPQPPGTAEIRFNIDTSAITLNGDVVGTFPLNGLPSGFQILTANIKFFTSQGTTPGDSTSLIRNGFVVATIDPDAGTSWNQALDVSGGPLAVFLDNYGWQVANTGGTIGGISWASNRQAGTFNTFLSGTYDLLGFPFTYDFPQSGDSVSPGDLITITSSGPSGVDFANLTLSVPCGVIVPIVQTTNLITFLVPDSCDGNLTTVVTATGNGVQFSGSVPLGTLIILLVNASGIYTLVTGQRHDEYYSNLRDGTTVDIKIPNPTARTGFIGG